ncbi:MAG: hypothetical protein KGJ84_07230 [Elusimicrobia bacterium]|nr:hypothetical protein [Elusimicrobiota bacterium]
MDIKDILMQNENSLPTLAQNLSTTTTQGGLPTITPSSRFTVLKFGASGIMGLLGMYYLAAGKKQNDVNKMLIGAGLTLASFFIF